MRATRATTSRPRRSAACWRASGSSPSRGSVALAGRRLGVAAVLAAGVLAFTAGDLRDQWRELGDRADRREQLGELVARAGGTPAIRACAPAFTVQPMKAMLAWRLDVPMAHLADRPRVPGAVFSAPPGYAGEPPAPRPPAAARPVARAGEWSLAAACGAAALTAPLAPRVSGERVGEHRRGRARPRAAPSPSARASCERPRTSSLR